MKPPLGPPGDDATRCPVSSVPGEVLEAMTAAEAAGDAAALEDAAAGILWCRRPNGHPLQHEADTGDRIVLWSEPDDELLGGTGG